MHVLRIQKESLKKDAPSGFGKIEVPIWAVNFYENNKPCGANYAAEHNPEDLGSKEDIRREFCEEFNLDTSDVKIIDNRQG